MSVGPSALGTVLVQRLDAVLGTTMAAHANLITGARANAVMQPGEAVRPGQTDAAGRAPRQPVDPAGAGGERGNTVPDAKNADALERAARTLVTRSDTTTSAPTTLGQTARTILALLALYPDQAPAAQGKAPLWQPAPQPDTPATARPGTGDATRPAPAMGTRADPTTASRAEPQAMAQAARAGSHALPMPPAAMLAGALRQALQGSGLFYESHLGDLAFGQRTVDQVRSEPQASLPRPPATPTAFENRSGQAAPAASAAGEMPGAGSSHGASSAGTHLSAPAGIHPDAAPLVRQQLDILANQALAWQGEAWPGTPMEWEVRRDAREGAAEAETHWATRLKLELPRLGLVEARLSLAGDELVMQLVAPRSAREINGAAQALRDGLQRAGLTLSHLSVGAVAPQPGDAHP
ncbi:flagellar hook-length control protein FliK [Bordetella sp. BOR01]|uniref:flagellar hook-length control protein FliK n=1 Tax=Bordetella sp. BOR01 TaxID=2854779 RepID=UPI001C483C95|nr:flagellar hook-length control protein FliK [Bordetella sp. BOR01]MBV7486313.1 flagellar hook-length control protein FliK [Bordetella sp. BOR01]